MKNDNIHIRNLLTLRRLPEFRDWLAAQGWKEYPPCTESYEVLRMRNQRGTWLLVHRRGSTAAGGPVQHCTVWGESAEWAKRFLRESRET